MTIMTIVRHPVVLLPMAALAIGLSSCGSDTLTGSDPGDPDPGPIPTTTGVFLDSEVQGLTFTSGTNPPGSTDANGLFQFTPGEPLTFSIGGIELGTLDDGAVVVTPNDFVVPGNVARFIQSFDVDGDPSNGIDVRAASSLLAGRSVASSVFANPVPASFASDPAIVDAIAAVPGAVLIDAATANANLASGTGGRFSVAELAGESFVLAVSGAAGFIVFDDLVGPNDEGSNAYLVMSDELPSEGVEVTWSVDAAGVLRIDDGTGVTTIARAGGSLRSISAIGVFSSTSGDEPAEPITFLYPLALTETDVVGAPITPDGLEKQSYDIDLGAQSVRLTYQSNGTVSGTGAEPEGASWTVNDVAPRALVLRRGPDPGLVPNAWQIGFFLDGSLAAGGEILLGNATYTGSDPGSTDPNLTWTDFAIRTIERLERIVLQPTASCVSVPDHAVATFEDSELEQKLRLDLALLPQEDLTCGHLSQVLSLSLGAPGLTSLVGIHNLSNLTDFTLQSTSVADLTPLAVLTGLTSLRIANSSGITDFSPISSLTGLTSLAISSSSVTDLNPILSQSFTSLTNLELDRNSIVDITALYGLGNLARLDLSFNAIVDIAPLHWVQNVTELNLANNSITDLGPLNSLVKLNVSALYLSQNSIFDIAPLEGFSGLTTLHLQDNDVWDLTPLEQLTSLTELNLGQNQIVNAMQLSGLVNVRDLTLDGNQISGYTFLTDLSNLRVLRLNAVGMGDTAGLALLTAGIENLQLAGNSISSTSMLARLTALDFLWLRDNPTLVSIEGLFENSGLGQGDSVNLLNTGVSCLDVATLAARGVLVSSDCPEGGE